jgi:subtilisin family serine protease
VAYVRAPETFYLDPIISDAPQPLATTDWGILDTKANQFWTIFAHRGEGIVVANIDSGVQWNHPALINQFKCPGAPADPACWYDPKNICGAGGACDNNGHGTHTMGTMVAADDPGLVYIAGMAPHAKWIACKGCESNTCSDLALSACADWLLQPGGNPANRPHVVNNSWGGGGGNPWYKAKVRAWLAAGIFPAFSAGNSGPLCRSLGSPGDYQESFATAGHQKANRSIATWSSRGPSRYGHAPYTKPNISAPGANICSTVPTNGWNCGYSGTSMASPHSAGAVALLWSCNPALIGQVQQTAELLQNNADAAPTGRCGAPPDGQGNYTYGYGYLNVLKAGQSTCP